MNDIINDGSILENALMAYSLKTRKPVNGLRIEVGYMPEGFGNELKEVYKGEGLLPDGIKIIKADDSHHIPQSLKFKEITYFAVIEKDRKVQLYPTCEIHPI